MENLLGFQPLKIPYGTQGKTLDFKIPPMVSWIAEDGFVNEFHIARYGGFAMGGYGSIILEATSVDSNGRISHGDIGLWRDEQIGQFQKLIESLHKEYYKGLKVGIQLGHAGRKASSSMPWKGFRHIPPEKGGFNAVAPSEIPFGNSTVPKAMTTDEVKKMVEKYVDAAERAVKAGVDFVEIHGAHGYLVNQFLCRSTNLRTDEYGGSFENRIRFLCEIVEGVQKRVGEFPIFVRLSCDEGVIREKEGDKEYNVKVREANKIRWTIESTCNLVEVLISKGVCFIDCSFGSVHQGQIWNTFPMWMVENSEAIKKRFGNKIHTSCVGEISEADQVEEILKKGRADVVQLGRESLANPYTPIIHLRKGGVKKVDTVSSYPIQHGYAIERLWSRQKK